MTTTPPPSNPSPSPSGSALQQGAANALHSVAKALGSMAARSDRSGPLVGLAQSASRHTGAWGHWLSEHDPAELVRRIRRRGTP